MHNTMVQHFVQQLRDNQDGINWLDEHFKKKLAVISEQEAFQKPSPEIHSIAELVWHIFIWRTESMKKLKDLNSELTMQHPFNWRPNDELETIGWDNLRDDLYNSQEALIALIENEPDAFLENEYAEGRSYKLLIEGLIQHDIYHLGQIGITIKLLKSNS